MTRRTACSLPDSSRTPLSEIADRKAALRLSCSGVNTFLPAFSLATGLEQASISDITVAVDTRVSDGQGGFTNGEPEFHRVTAFGALGENTAAQLKSGDRVVVGGELQFRSWTDAETGKRRNGTEIVAQHVGASTRFNGSVTVNRGGRQPHAAATVTETGPVASPTEPARGPSMS